MSLSPASIGAANHTLQQVADKIWTYNARPRFEVGTLVEDIPKTLAVHRNAFISRREAVKRDGGNFKGIQASLFRGAVYDAQGKILSEFTTKPDALRNYDNPLEIPTDRLEAARRLDGNYIYLGNFHDHFGHFLLESLARAWALLEQDANARVIFQVDVVSPTQRRLPDFISVILDALGVGDDRIVLINEDVVVGRLIVPTAQVRLLEVASPGMCSVYDHVHKVLALRNPSAFNLRKKIYLTRSRLIEEAINVGPAVLGRGMGNERDVEALFIARGFEIIAPEKLPIEEQINLIANATHIAGSAGSAMHAVVFNAHPDTQVISIDTRYNRTQYTLEAARGLDALHIFCVNHRNDKGTRFVDIEMIERALAEWVPPGSPMAKPEQEPALRPVQQDDSGNPAAAASPGEYASTTSPKPAAGKAKGNDTLIGEGTSSPAIAGGISARRIRQIAQHVSARSYLEIGVAQGHTFNGLTFAEKVAVDPTFRGNPAEFQKDGVELVISSSDDYFLKTGTSRHFDIIFLDGWHTYQQTFRDFCNSMSCAHDGTVWMIGSVYPSDVYSASPSPRDANEARRRAGVRSADWHGDVFKVIFTIHDFFPTMTYVTMGSGGNAQTIVWKRPRANFSPALGRLESIERLGYFDLLRREAVLNIMPEEEALEFFAASMSDALSKSGPST